MRKLLLALFVLAAVLFDYLLFPGLGLDRVAPSVMIALFVSLAVLRGALPAVPIAAAVGLILDIGFNRFVGMSAIPYLIAALAGALFYKRFYADNIIIPAVTAATAAFAKELFLLASLLLSGGRVSGFFALFALHMLPVSLLTGAACALIHLLLKRYLLRSSFRLDIDYLR
ncbi:MAG: rod shape-determining protein MreD [Clostridia bacterium]|nr:rod shape-determining protein MreD [Clostridia bacterium]